MSNTFYTVFDCVHCDSLEFKVGGVDARRDDFRSQDELAQHLCQEIGIELIKYDLFQRIPSQDGTAQITFRSGRWLEKLKRS